MNYIKFDSLEKYWVIIDDLMFMAIDRHEVNLFFQLINQLYGQTSIIVTSNKGPEEWGDILGDPARLQPLFWIV